MERKMLGFYQYDIDAGKRLENRGGKGGRGAETFFKIFFYFRNLPDPGNGKT